MFLKITKTVLWIIVSIFGIIGFILFFSIIFNEEYFNFSFDLDTKLASDFGQFFGGFIGTMFGISSTLLILVTLISQSIENRKTQIANNFFKLLDYHNDNVKQLSVPHIDIEKCKKGEKADGRSAFVVFKLQLRELIHIVDKINKNEKLHLTDTEIIDIAYISFYYGIDNEWENFSEDKFSNYKHKKIILKNLLQKKKNTELKIGRTNQTSLSAYFRNMYNAIKLIDNNKYLTNKEKSEYIKILRAQLSNPELYILFFNLVSRFGKKWIENKYITRYQFVKNIPNKYCDRFNPKDYFPMVYEDEEIS